MVPKGDVMTTLDERFQKGLEVRARLAGGQGRSLRGSVPIAYELAPDMYRISTESLYGSIWSRPGLDLKYRVMATLTAAAIQLSAPQVRAQIRNALNVGITPEELAARLPALRAIISHSATDDRYGPPRPGDVNNSCLAIDVIENDLGWRPKFDLAAGIADMIRKESGDQ